MRITKLTAENFKGASFSNELSPVTVFYGRNFSHKSSRLEAVTLALTWTLPGIEQTPRAVYERLASGNPMRVELLLDSGPSAIDCTWQQRNGTVSGPKGRACNVTLDPGEFLNLSSAERVKYLFQVAKLPPELNRTAVQLTVVTNLVDIRLEPHTAFAEVAIKAAVDIAKHPQAPSGTQEYINSLADEFRQRKLLADQNVKRLRATNQGVTQVSDASPPQPDAEQRLAEARERYTAAVKAHEAAFQKHAQAVTRREELEALAGQGTEVDNRALADALAHAARLGSDPVPDPGPQKPSADDMARVRALIESGDEQVLKLEAEVAQCEQDLAELKVDKKAKCSKCGQSLGKLKAKLVKATRDRICELNAKRVGLEQGLDDARRRQNEMRGDLDAWTRQFNAHGIWKRNSEIAATAVTDAKNRASILCAAMAGVVSAREKLPDAKLREEALLVVYMEAGKELDFAKLEVETADREHRKLVAWRSEQATKARATEAAQQAEAEAGVFKAACAMVLELQAKLVEAAVGPLVAKVNELCVGILEAPLELRDGELGLDSPTGFVSHRTFSGTQRALAYAALCVALASENAFRLVLIDEASRLDKVNLDRLIGRLCALVNENKIDQALLVTTERPEGWRSDHQGELVQFTEVK